MPLASWLVVYGQGPAHSYSTICYAGVLTPCCGLLAVGKYTSITCDCLHGLSVSPCVLLETASHQLAGLQQCPAQVECVGAHCLGCCSCYQPTAQAELQLMTVPVSLVGEGGLKRPCTSQACNTSCYDGRSAGCNVSSVINVR